MVNSALFCVLPPDPSYFPPPNDLLQYIPAEAQNELKDEAKEKAETICRGMKRMENYSLEWSKKSPNADLREMVERQMFLNDLSRLINLALNQKRRPFFMLWWEDPCKFEPTLTTTFKLDYDSVTKTTRLTLNDQEFRLPDPDAHLDVRGVVTMAVLIWVLIHVTTLFPIDPSSPGLPEVYQRLYLNYEIQKWIFSRLDFGYLVDLKRLKDFNSELSGNIKYDPATGKIDTSHLLYDPKAPTSSA